MSLMQAFMETQNIQVGAGVSTIFKVNLLRQVVTMFKISLQLLKVKHWHCWRQ
jgi:hypothetical protein